MFTVDIEKLYCRATQSVQYQYISCSEEGYLPTKQCYWNVMFFSVSAWSTHSPPTHPLTHEQET